MFRSRWALALLFLSVSLAACARYEAIPWKDVPGSAASVVEVAGKIVSSLEGEVRRNQKIISGRGRGGRAVKTEGRSDKLRALRIVIAAFPEARTGLRTGFSERLEKAVRAALAKSPLFEVIDGGNGVSWQEAGFSHASVAPGEGWRGVFGRLDEEIAIGQEQGKNLQAIREELDRKLNDDHPLKGFWPEIQKGKYGERSAIFAASMLAADAVVYGAYALGPDRVRVWASIVMNRPAQSRYFRRGMKDILGLPEYLESSRPYLGFVRGEIPRKSVPDSWLSVWIPPRPRTRPRHPTGWGEPALSLVLEQLDPDGRRYPLSGGEIFDTDMVVVGKFAVSARRYVFGFAVDKSGNVEVIYGSAEGKGKPGPVDPGKTVHFTVRLLPPNRTYRVYFVSSEASFDTKKIVANAFKRLGISESSSISAANYREVAEGAPRVSWYVPPGQDRLILEDGWDQYVFWFHRVSR